MTMRHMRWLMALPILLVAGFAAQNPKGSCTDIPLRVTIRDPVVDPITGETLTSAITSDGRGEYVNGVSGVSAVINVCSSTYDAVVIVKAPKRTFTYQFTPPIPDSIIQEQPTWVPGTWSISGWINVRNLLYSKQPFTTHVGSTFTLPGNGSTYRLRFMPFTVDAPDMHTNPNEILGENTPYSSSNAKVYPQPFDCNSGGTTKPSWIVVGNNLNDQGILQVGTLRKLINGQGSSTHEGQYMMPFELRIEALQCFTY
jgi:hypothetical protein